MGFRELCVYTEWLSKLSAVRHLPAVLWMRKQREVLSFRWPAQVGASYCLLAHSDPLTVALPMGFGVKFYTGLDDETLLLSTSFPSLIAPRNDRRLRKYSEPRIASIADSWRRHQQRVAVLVAEGTAPTDSHDFDGFVKMSRREEDALFGPRRR